MELIEFEHPLTRDVLTRMRSTATSAASFRELSSRVSTLLAVEATRNLSTSPVEVDTPFEPTWGELCSEAPVIVAILRAGLGMLTGFSALLPDSPVSFLGFRSCEEGSPELFVDALPSVEGRQVLLLHPVLAAGAKADAAIEHLTRKGCSEMVLITVLAAPEGIARLDKYDDLTIITGSVERELDEEGFARPGIGDYGLRLFSG